MFSVLFYLKNWNKFTTNSEIYHTDTSRKANFQQLSVYVNKYQKGVYCLGVKCDYNMLPSYNRIESDNPKIFKLILQKFFYMKFPFILQMDILNFTIFFFTRSVLVFESLAQN